MDIELKEKIPVTSELLTELASKGWQEIEHLQAQLSNLDDNHSVKQLLQNLITSYYVFIGGIENLQTGTTLITKAPIEPEKKIIPEITDDFDEPEPFDLASFYSKETVDTQESDSEPFEYFVDFDEPVGEPISDEELYGVN